MKRPEAADDMSTSELPTPAAVLQRVRGVVGGLPLDCGCRATLDAALSRFEVLEGRRQARRFLQDARRQADRLAALLDLARELDDVTSDEPDRSVYDEIALLFDAMAEAAARGAEDVRLAGRVQAGP